MSKNIDPDPERLIYDYVRPFFIVPTWVPANSYSECHACHSKFSSGHRHNCRLCGQLFCSACSAKYHIPPEYEQKKKTGPARVCHGCKDSAMDRGKQAAQERAAGNPNGLSTLVAMTDASMTPERLTTLEARSNRSSTIVKNSKTGRVVFYPPVWVPLDSQSDCFKCREPFAKKKKHHCRTCGRMFCESCSSKMPLPDAYLAPKNKSGPARVCDMCRFLIKSGATLSTDAAPSDLPPPRTHAPSEAVPIPASLSKLGDTALTVLWDSNVAMNGSGSFVAELSDKTRKKTLKQLHSALLDARPELSENPFVYTYRGIVIPTEFYEVFSFEHLAPKLIIRPEEPVVNKSASSTTLLAYKQIAEHSRSPSEMSSLSNFDAYAEPKSETGNKSGTLTRVLSFTTPPSATQLNSHIRTANNIRGLPAVDENNTSVSESSPSNSVSGSRPSANESLRSASVSGTPTSPNAASGINSVSASTILRRRAKVVSYVISLYPYEKKSDPAHLQCDAGELILISRRDNDQWWFGEVHRSGARGWVPASYVQVIPKPEEIEEEEARLRTLAAMEEKQQQQQQMKAALPISASGTFSSRPLSPKARRGLDDVAAQINTNSRTHAASSESYRTLPLRNQSSSRAPIPSGFESDSGSGDDVPPPPPPQQSEQASASQSEQQPGPIEYADVKHNENEPQETWDADQDRAATQPAGTKPIYIALPKPPSMSNLNISPSNAAAANSNIAMSAQRARTASTQEMTQVLKARSQLFK